MALYGAGSRPDTCVFFWFLFSLLSSVLWAGANSLDRIRVLRRGTNYAGCPPPDPLLPYRSVGRSGALRALFAAWGACLSSLPRSSRDTKWSSVARVAAFSGAALLSGRFAGAVSGSGSGSGFNSAPHGAAFDERDAVAVVQHAAAALASPVAEVTAAAELLLSACVDSAALAGLYSRLALCALRSRFENPQEARKNPDLARTPAHTPDTLRSVLVRLTKHFVALRSAGGGGAEAAGHRRRWRRGGGRGGGGGCAGGRPAQRLRHAQRWDLFPARACGAPVEA